MAKRLEKILCLVLILFHYLGAEASEFCEQALIQSQSASVHFPKDLRVRFKSSALEEASKIGLSRMKLESLILQSQVKSFEKGEREVLLLFHPLRTKEKYRDYVYEVTIRERFIPGRSKDIQILSFSDLTERREKSLLHDLAKSEQVESTSFFVRNLDLGAVGVGRVSHLIEMSAKVRIKLLLKHRIELKLIKEVFDHRPDVIKLSDRSRDYIDLIYTAGGESLIVVLAKNRHRKALALVTAYFFRGVIK